MPSPECIAALEAKCDQLAKKLPTLNTIHAAAEIAALQDEILRKTAGEIFEQLIIRTRTLSDVIYLRPQG